MPHNRCGHVPCCTEPAWKEASQPLVCSMTMGLLGGLARPPVLTFFGEHGGMELSLGDSKLTVTKDGQVGPVLPALFV